MLRMRRTTKYVARNTPSASVIVGRSSPAKNLAFSGKGRLGARNVVKNAALVKNFMTPRAAAKQERSCLVIVRGLAALAASHGSRRTALRTLMRHGASCPARRSKPARRAAHWRFGDAFVRLRS